MTVTYTGTTPAHTETGISELPMVCMFCPSTKVEVQDSWVNYNGGDDVIKPHLHVNLLYQCDAQCRPFVVRAEIARGELYYGDIAADNGIHDTGPPATDPEPPATPIPGMPFLWPSMDTKDRNVQARLRSLTQGHGNDGEELPW